MRICVVHNTLNSVGGGERVCLSVIELLKSLGHEVTLITVEPTDWVRIERIIGKVIKPDREVHLSPFRVRAFGIYMRLLTFIMVVKERKKCKLIINTHGDALPITSDIIYMHYPTFAIIKESSANIKYFRSLLWRLYFYPYEKVQGYLVKRMKWKVLITNSEYSREAIKKYVGADAVIIYPPVELGSFLKVAGNEDRENRVVLCGRYTPEKNYEFALKVARRMPEVKFTIIGASSGKVSSTYYRKLQQIKEELGLDNVELLKDVPREEQVRLYSKSKVFMHTMKGEHFGIAVVEGMAAGLVPVVHKSGGPWRDILNFGKYGLGYETVEEAVTGIKYALENYEILKSKAIKRATMFSKEKFMEKFKEILRELDIL